MGQVAAAGCRVTPTLLKRLERAAEQAFKPDPECWPARPPLFPFFLSTLPPLRVFVKLPPGVARTILVARLNEYVQRARRLAETDRTAATDEYKREHEKLNPWWDALPPGEREMAEAQIRQIPAAS
jgi:hypothetical protein